MSNKSKYAITSSSNGLNICQAYLVYFRAADGRRCVFFSVNICYLSVGGLASPSYYVIVLNCYYYCYIVKIL